MLLPGQLAVVIPCHNEASAIGSVVAAARQHVGLVIVVDDGSTDATAKLAANAGAQVIRQPQRRGKGSALRTGLRTAAEQGAKWAFTLDGDGQHEPADIPRFIQTAASTRTQLVVGNRMGEAHKMPGLRRAVNRFMSAVLSRIARQHWPDSQCGFRLLNLERWSQLDTQTKHFEFESELLLAFARAGQVVQFVPIAVIYRDERSKISPVLDTVRWLRWLRTVRRAA